MNKISLENLDSLGIERLSRGSLKTILGGEVCPAGFMKCSGCMCHYIDDDGGCGADAGIPVIGVPGCNPYGYEDDCVMCETDGQFIYKSCWFVGTPGGGQNMCERVYPGKKVHAYFVNCKTNNCTMN